MCEILIRNGLLRQCFVHWKHLLNICWYWSQVALTIFIYQCIAFCSVCKRGKIFSENWNTSQTNFLKLWWIFQLGYICNYSGCLWEGEGLGVRCGEKLTFYAVSFYVFFFFSNFFPYVCVSFLEQNKTSYFLKSVSPKANLEHRPGATCQFAQFFPRIPSPHSMFSQW